MRLLGKILNRAIREGRLVVIDHKGREHSFGDPAAEPLRVRLTKKGTVWRIARDPAVGAGEAYMDGELVVEPPHDIRDLILFVSQQSKNKGSGIDAPNPLRRLASRIGAKLDQQNHRVRARKNVEHHYDLTRRFYELFLDTDRQYTMAYFRDPANTLEQAQLDKKALIAAKLRLGPG